jgi:pimeloyl-ACP methyl ester carboxylesterase
VAARDDLADVIVGVVSVSAPQAFRGLVAQDVVSRISAPILFIASEGDEEAARSLESLFRRANEPKDQRVFSGSAHGTQLLESAHIAEFKALVLNFIRGVSSR